MLVCSTIFGAVAGFALLAGPVAAVALPSADGSEHAIHAPQKRTSYEVDMADACHREHGDTWTAIKKGDHCDQWACLNTGTLQELGLDISTYCFELYGSNSYSSCSKNAWDWRCNTY
jgi:hypothetical protein